MDFNILREIGIINTLRFNWRYFKCSGLVKPKVLCSRNVILKRLDGNVMVDEPKLGGVKIGFGNVGIIDGKKEKAIWENCGIVCFQTHARLDVGTRIVCSSTGVLFIGENVQITGRSSIICYQEVKIGDQCLISWDNLLMDTDFHKIYELEDKDEKTINDNQRIFIGNHVWIGCRCMVLKGACIPENSVVAAGSIVTKENKTADAVYVNNVAKKKGIGWKS